MRSIGWHIVTYNKSQIFIKKIPLIPYSVGKILHSHYIMTDQEIKDLKRKYKLITFSYEPFVVEKNEIGRIYWQVNKHSMQLTPTKTLWLDLSKSQEKLLSNLKSKTRYNLKLATEKLDFEIISGEHYKHSSFVNTCLTENSQAVRNCCSRRTGNRPTIFIHPSFVKRARQRSVPGDLGGREIKQGNVYNSQIIEILTLWSTNKPYSWLFPAPKAEFLSLLSSFGRNSFIVRSYQKDKPKDTLAFCLILCSPNMAFYWHNASSELGKQFFAPTLCAWQAIMESKKRKLQIFDFEGLFDERFPKRNKNWKGFSRFKEGFFPVRH